MWIARFGGDLMYYCSPNVKPGSFYPWIPYDSRVHTMQIRRYDNNSRFVTNVPDWTKDDSMWTWEYPVKRLTSGDKSKYESLMTWQKYKVLSSGALQRNCQREGLNIQFLEYWQNKLYSDYSIYDGEADYIMGFDDDELFYINSNHYDAQTYPPTTGNGIAKLDSLPSRGMPEGIDQIYDIHTGYPQQGFPLNIVISAYLKNREDNIKNNKIYSTYDGYEIQDIGISESFPDGTGVGNNTHPGIIKVRAGGKTVNIKLNASTPLSDNRGFYGALQGNRWPAYYEPQAQYTLYGLSNLTINELDKISIEYEGSDALGEISRVEHKITDLTESEKTAIISAGYWSVAYDCTRPAYSCVTAYYEGYSGEKIILAGKELKPIFLLFCGETSLEGKGLGAKIWLNDFRDTKTDEYSVLRMFGSKEKYTKPYVRKYIFPLGTTTTFQTWDGDPHMFDDPNVEWFLSSRTLAKRIPDSYLDGTSQEAESPYLTYYVDDVLQETGRSGKNFTYTWNNAGEHTLRVQYRLNGNLTSYEHIIKIEDYPTTSMGNQIGEISHRNLSDQEAEWLGVSQTKDNYTILEVEDIYSSYTYTDGVRVNTPYVNRWADNNDYAEYYQWNYETLDIVTTFINNYSTPPSWFWNYWALHYSSNWRDNLPDGLPTYVPNDVVTRVYSYELDTFSSKIKTLFDGLTSAPKWQYTVPLVSYTDSQGYRMRTNPSCIYDINYIFNEIDGAFTGNILLPSDPSVIQAPDITDEQKDQQEFYYKLLGKKILIIDSSKITTSTEFYATNIYMTTQGSYIASMTYVP